ncbi:MAG TPA: SagB/ThcOx family dehydrogenase [Candidatus Brocadiia bacterium]|nr:SagB/ThcOx family dehydrogenase [Candidatus Brocadiia bacterium]
MSGIEDSTPEELAARIGEVYQEVTKYAPGKAGRIGPRERNPGPYKDYPDAKRISLPEPQRDLGAGLWGLLEKRRSRRDFSDEPMTLNELSQLLWAGQGVTCERHGFQFRTAPSAGALYPCETYVFVHLVEGLQRGLYHYPVRRHEIELVKSGDYRAGLAEACLGQEMAGTCAAAFAWTGVIPRCRSKYAQRAYRYAYLDAGHIAQNLFLAAEALDLGCCNIGALFDDQVNALLDVDGRDETILYIAVTGR